MLTRLRTLLFWCHLATGVLVAAVVLTMSVTGVLLTYQRQLTAWADTRALDGAPPTANAAATAVPLPLALLVERARAAAPAGSAPPSAVTWRAGAAAPVEIAFGRERTLFVNAYTGAVLGEGARGVRAAFTKVVALHRYLGAEGERRSLGKAVTGAMNLLFLFLVVSGAVLWWPRNRARAALRNVLLFRRGLAGKARDFNWHNVIGVWSAMPLFVVVLSGVVISYPWATGLVYRVVGDTPPAPAAAAPAAASRTTARDRATPAAPALTGLDAMRARAADRVADWRSITLQLPRADTGAVTVAIDRGTGGQPQHRATLTFDRATGVETKWEPFAAGTPGRRLRSVLRFAHTGEVLGLAGQTLAGLVSLGASLLVWTGIALSWRRLVTWRRRRASIALALPD